VNDAVAQLLENGWGRHLAETATADGQILVMLKRALTFKRKS